jgi:hypothetical protein
MMNVVNNNDGRSYEAAAPYAVIHNGAELSAWKDAWAAASNPGADVTHGSTNWIMRTERVHGAEWRDLPLQYEIGPFGSAGTNYHFVFFRDARLPWNPDYIPG